MQLRIKKNTALELFPLRVLYLLQSRHSSLLAELSLYPKVLLFRF